ncbi:LCP family protein [Nesterenkonia sp. CL21]|uniref:LCP family protein n=1 Tax=unclassified Nesterenkonia TaxID=2629769 RepID=UPI00287AA329|nr:LCP family protein [Nesterenkonia sp. CL21]MDS2171574.1 LCP family protein [Nesterenkonia sp. CL21]
MADHDSAAGRQPHRPRRAKRLSETAASAASASEAAPTRPSADASDEKRTRRRRRRRIAGWSLVAVTAVVVVAVVAAGLYLRQLQTDFDENRNVLQMDLEDETADRTNDGVINMLLLGSDSRGEGLDLAEVKGEDGERSDTMMFVHIPADRSGVYVMSIVRDLWVDVPGHGEGRINSALDAGGYELVIDTVEELLDTHIDHIGIIDFDGFEELTTALEGVYVDNPVAFSAGQLNPSFYPEGTIRLEGSDALRYVRERKSFLEGDFMRVQNQQRVVQAIVDRFLSADTLTSPQRISDAVNSIVPYLWMDEGLDSGTAVDYAIQLRDLRSQDIHMFTIPTGEPTVTSGGAQVLLKDEEALELLSRSLRQENMDGFLEYLDSQEEQDAPEDLTVDPMEDQEPGQGELTEEESAEGLVEDGAEVTQP